MATGFEEAALIGAIKAMVATLAKPVAVATFNGLKNLSDDIVSVFADRLTEYASAQFEKHSCLSTIVFQHQKSIYDLYIPLTVVSNKGVRDGQKSAGITIDRIRPDFLPQGAKILITDTAGMGKSTLSKFLFLQCLKSGYAIPFFIELRHLSGKVSVLDVIVRQLNSAAVDDDELRFNKRQIQRMFKKNNLIFFLDGYDEIAPSAREDVTKNIKELIEGYPNNTYVITSRPESGLLAFPSFSQYSIRPLTLEESYTLIRKYDEGGGMAEQLIRSLQSGEFRAVREFLKNPLLTSLLYRSFEYKQSVPLKKHVFYRQVYDALFDWHDATKDGYNTREKKSGLDIDAFHRILRVVGFYSVMTGKVEGDTDTVLSWIRKAKQVCNATSLSESFFLEDLIRAVPLFVRDGDLYRWSHKSLSEYFAAQYICTEGKADQKRTLEAIMESTEAQRFSNVLDQIYDVDNNAFREYLILPVANAFGDHWGVAYRQTNPEIPEEDVKIRRAATFDRAVIFLDRFDFKSYNEFRLAIGKIEGVREKDFLVSDMIQLHGDEPGAILSSSGPHCLILTILRAKKDPLVYRQEFLVQAVKRGVRMPKLRAAAVLDDSPQNLFNSVELFSKITRIITAQLPVANPDKMLNFPKELNGTTQLSSFADELLKSLQK